MHVGYRLKELRNDRYRFVLYESYFVFHLFTFQGSPAGPPSKKLASSLAGSMGRKPEEGIKDKKPLFELPSAWRELAEGDTITGSEFDAKKEEIIKKAESTAEPESAGTSEGEDKKESVAKNSVEKFVLIALRSLAESSRGDAELTQKLLQFIISEAKNCKVCFLDLYISNLYPFSHRIYSMVSLNPSLSSMQKKTFL